VPDWPRVPRVVTVHDLAAFHADTMPRDFAVMIRARIEQLARLEGPLAVITPTAAMGDELAERVPALAGRIHPVPHGCDHVAPPPAPVAAAAPPYFLFVGNVEKRKNVGGLVAAFGRCAARHAEARLVIAGKPGFGGEGIERAVAASPAADRIDRRPWLAPDALPALYAGARGLVFPTWYEGFGFPIVEAMRCGCPVITSDRGAMAEVAGDAALLVDPADTEAVAAAMGRLLTDESLHADLVARGRRRSADFTWDRCAQETLTACAAVAGG
jgi:glycosyltransferase involved in cell wall biosynthesis